MKVLIVDDEPNLLESLSEFLAQEGFEVLRARSIAEAEAEVSKRPDAIVLDWRLPDGQGIDLLREWRRSGMSAPILLLTARADLMDKVLGLELGADDYVTKPFEPRELLARIRARIRAAAAPASTARPATVLEAAGITINLEEREVRFRGRLVELSRMELALLRHLVENPNRVFSREELLNRVWGFESYPTTRTVDTHIHELRQKIAPEPFETVRGIGYRLISRSSNEDLTAR